MAWSEKRRSTWERVGALEEHNAQLREQIASMEKAIYSLREEVREVRQDVFGTPVLEAGYADNAATDPGPIGPAIERERAAMLRGRAGGEGAA